MNNEYFVRKFHTESSKEMIIVTSTNHDVTTRWTFYIQSANAFSFRHEQLPFRHIKMI